MGVLLLVSALAAVAPAAGPVHIRGQVADPNGDPLPNALITALPRRPDGRAVHSGGNFQGIFTISEVHPGSWSVTVWVQGFRAKRIDVVAHENAPTDLGVIILDPGSCDAPGVMCDSFGLAPPEHILADGTIGLPVSCGIELRKTQIRCGHAVSKADVVLVRLNDGAVLIRPANGALISAVNPPEACPEARYSTTDLRVDGLSRGFDFCVRTRKGVTAHLFPVEDIPTGSTEVSLRYVVRPR